MIYHIMSLKKIYFLHYLVVYNKKIVRILYKIYITINNYIKFFIKDKIYNEYLCHLYKFKK